jgi:methyl-accepting chemotaxis protein
VADEVRKLAMRAAEAAKNTANLIDDTIKRIKEGSEVAVRTNSEFAQVEDSSANMRELVGEIAAASTEQSQGIDQISKAVSEMDKVVQQNSANAGETASASKEISAQAEHMKEFVGELVALVSGRNANGSVRPARTASRPARVLPAGEFERDVYHRPKGNGKSPVNYGKRGPGPAQTISFDEAGTSEF